MKTLYLSDLDGTLLRADATLSRFSKRLLGGLIGRGMLFSYATARSFSSASVILRGLDLRLPAITYNGTFCVDAATGKVLANESFTQGECDALVGLFAYHHLFPLVYSLTGGVERVSWLRGSENEGTVRYLAARRGDPRLTGVQDLSQLFAGGMFYFNLIGEESALAPLAEALDTLPGVAYTLQRERYGQGEYWLEIMPCRATKANGVRWLRQFTGADRVVCFGDAVNDIPMFEEADECYAVSNASPELLQVADGIIGEAGGDGVAAWLADRFLQDSQWGAPLESFRK